jgi:hypothetical protein
MSTARNACIALAVAAIAAPAFAQSQSLAEVARKEEARRAAVKAPAKAYTNANLKPGEINNAAAEPAGEMPSIASKNPANAELKKKESTFRSTAQALRERLQKAQDELKAMTATAADTNRSSAERGVAAKRVAARRSDLDDLEKQWLKLETDASKMAIPREWLEPIPEISSRPQQ